MAFPLPLIGAAVGFGTNMLQRHWRKKEEQSRRQYEQERETDRRNYDREMWRMVNQYNHPLQQMQRLADAGLNPNLIYGSSPGSAVGNAQQIATGKQLQGQAPQYSIDNPINTFMNTKVQQAQSNNLRSQSNLNTANAIKSISQSGLAKVQKNQIEKLLPGNLEIQQEQIKQMNIGTFLKTLEKTGKSKFYLANMAAETNKAIAEGDIAQASIELAKLNERLATQGIRPTDPLWIKLMGQVFGLDLDNMNTNNPTVKPEDRKNLRGFIESMINYNKQ